MSQRAVAVVLLGILVLSVLLGGTAGAQTTRYVDNIGTCAGLGPCHSTIAAAVDAAATGDTIAVFPGVYPETARIIAKDSIALRGADARMKPVIAPPSGNRGVVVNVSPRIQVLDLAIYGGIEIGSPRSSGYVIQGNTIHGGVVSHGASGGTVRSNTFVGGGLSGDLNAAVIEGNRFFGAGITLSEFSGRPDGNTIRHNVLREGGISLNTPAPADNTIEANFVSGNAGDGISVGVGVLSGGGTNMIRGNTSVENVGCDINDRGNDHGNTWTLNRVFTACGHAID